MTMRRRSGFDANLLGLSWNAISLRAQKVESADTERRYVLAMNALDAVEAECVVRGVI